MTQTAATELRATVTGPVLGPDDAGYDDARRLWNAEHDRRPAVIAQVQSAADVQAAVRYGVAQGLEIAVRGGSHSMSGASSVDDGLMIDLSLMNQVTVDPETHLARVGGGAKLADLDEATQKYGLAVPAGMISHTGVGGLTLGGGMGWLTRKFGLSIDNLESVQIVTADGSILRANDEENPELFWAVRGGGGNFGVVTEFEFRLNEAGPMVNYDLLFWGLDQGADVLRFARELIPTLSADENVVIACLNAPPAPFVPAELHFQPGYALVVVGFGTADEHQAVVDQIRAALPPLFEFGTPMPYVALQKSLDEPNAWGHYSYEKGTYLEELTDGAIEAITRHFPRKTSPLSVAMMYRLDHAYSAVDDNETAFSGERTDRYALFVIGHALVADALPAEREWARTFWAALQPYSAGIGSYVNGMTEAEDDRIKAAYGAKYDRLALVKAKYDPDNVFHRNQNIKPAF